MIIIRPKPHSLFPLSLCMSYISRQLLALKPAAESELPSFSFMFQVIPATKICFGNTHVPFQFSRNLPGKSVFGTGSNNYWLSLDICDRLNKNAFITGVITYTALGQIQTDYKCAPAFFFSQPSCPGSPEPGTKSLPQQIKDGDSAVQLMASTAVFVVEPGESSSEHMTRQSPVSKKPNLGANTNKPSLND